MQDDSYNGRDETLMQMREMAKKNQDHMRGHSVHFSGMIPGEAQTEEVRGGASAGGGTFGLRLFLCLMIWGGFFWMHMEDAPILGYQTEQVVEAVSTDTGLQDIADSVKIKK